MTNYLTKTQANEQKQSTPKKEFYYFGEIHPHIFNDWDEKNAKGEKMYVLISHLGHHEIDNTVLPKAKCPVCGKEEISVYSCCASVLSGANVLKGYCSSCDDIIAFEDNDYYHMVRDYIIKTKNPLGDKSKLVGK